MKTDLLPDETLVKQGPANLQRGAETVGGKLFLTNQRLVFESHRLNIQTGTTIIALATIARTTPCWTKFLNLIPLAPNSLEVSTTQAEQHRFVLYGRKAWKLAIESQTRNHLPNQ